MIVIRSIDAESVSVCSNWQQRKGAMYLFANPTSLGLADHVSLTFDYPVVTPRLDCLLFSLKSPHFSGRGIVAKFETVTAFVQNFILAFAAIDRRSQYRPVFG